MRQWAVYSLPWYEVVMMMAAGGLGEERTEAASNASRVARRTRHSNHILSRNPGDVDRGGGLEQEAVHPHRHWTYVDFFQDLKACERGGGGGGGGGGG